MQNLIIGESFDYILLFMLGFLPLLYKLFFWLYTIQLKEYRWDRFKEYLRTKQGKHAMFNIFSVLEFVLFIASVLLFVIYYKTDVQVYLPFWGCFYSIIFYYLIFLNIFVFGKIFRKRVLKPKFTGRTLILILLFIIGGSIDLYYFFNGKLWNYSYLYILGVYIFLPVILFFYNFISLPLVNHLKNKKINSAIKKSEKVDSPIKIAITGSYGKSSVKEFLSSILEQDTPPNPPLEGGVLKTPENINTELGVSSIVLNKLKNNYKYFIAEIGAYRKGEISILGKIVNHKYGFLTAIGNQHIGLFGNQENIIKGKFEILEKVKENNGFLYVNADNEYIEKYIGQTQGLPLQNIIKYGINGKKLDAKSKILEINNLKTKFEFNYNGIQEIFETNLIGEHNILNLTGILAFCYDIGLRPEDLKKYLLDIKSPKSTGNIYKVKINNNPSQPSFNTKGKSNENEITIIDDTYNLSIDGLYSGIGLLKYFKDKEKILVLDDILELGRDAKKIHYIIAKKIAENKHVDKVLFVGVNYKEDFEKGLIEGGFNEKNIMSAEVISSLKAGNNSIILFEGKKAKIYLNKINNGT